MTELWIGLGSVVLLIVGCFATGWWLGGSSREEKIRRKGLEDVNAHYQKMAEDFKTVDETVDNAKSLLGSRVRNNKNRSPKVSAAAGTPNRKNS